MGVGRPSSNGELEAEEQGRVAAECVISNSLGRQQPGHLAHLKLNSIEHGSRPRRELNSTYATWESESERAVKYDPAD